MVLRENDWKSLQVDRGILRPMGRIMEILLEAFDNLLVGRFKTRPKLQTQPVLSLYDLLEDGSVREGVDRTSPKDRDVLRPVTGGLQGRS